MMNGTAEQNTVRTEGAGSGADVIRGTVAWAGDDPAVRPKFVEIHILNGGTEIDGSPVRVYPGAKSDDDPALTPVCENAAAPDRPDLWVWQLTAGEDAGPASRLTVREEFQDNDDAGLTTLEYDARYLQETRGTDIVNTWQADLPDTVVYRVSARWENPGVPEDLPGITAGFFDFNTDQRIATLRLNAGNGWEAEVPAADDGSPLNGLQPGDYYILVPDPPRNVAAACLNPEVTLSAVPARDGWGEPALLQRTITYPVSCRMENPDGSAVLP